MNTKLERYFSALLFLASLFFLYMAWGYVAPIAYDPLGPRPYPVLILGLMAVCTLFLTVRPKSEMIDLGYTPKLIKNLAICLVAMLAYALLFEVLGFPIATAIMATVVGKLFDGKTLYCVISGVVMGVLLFYMFDIALDVPLPAGILEPILR